MKKFFKRNFGPVFRILHLAKEQYYCFLGKYFPKKLIQVWFKEKYGRMINLESPVTIDEKVNWMKLYADYSLWTKCADKYEVRSYITEMGLGHTLNECYGVYSNADEINFDDLPNQFVIKTTNGGGGKSVLIVKDKNGINIEETKAKLNKWLKTKVGLRYYEPHYFDIKPRLLIEKYLEPNEGEISLVDFKFNCFDGEVHSVSLCSDREFNKSVHYSIYNTDWQLRPECIVGKYRTEKLYPKPKSFDKMVEYSKQLSKGFPFVRVDWYEINGEPVFSELTFTPGGGFRHFYSEEFLIELGNELDLNKVTRRKNV